MKKYIPGLIFLILLTGTIILNSCQKDPVLATLTTSGVTNITITSFSAGGSILKDGDAEITDRGICYSLSATPDVTGLHTSADKGNGSFSTTITGLTPNTIYHIRAYATNKVGTAYGNEVTASTTPLVVPTLSTVSVTSISVTSAVSGGNITSDGNDPVTSRGVCWATAANPTITNDKTSDGTGSGSFISDLTGLTAATTYHVRSYATNSVGTAYGNDVIFTTSPVVIPTLTTTAVTELTTTTAVSGGNITSDGGGAILSRGVCWSATAGPTIANSKTSNGTGTGYFISSIAGLTPSTEYHLRAYATNSAGTAYGNDITFTASTVVLPALTTTAVTAITLTTAVSGGNITTDGGGSVTARGVCWSTTTAPTIANSKTTDDTGTGNFTSNLTSLLPGTTYYVRSYATNAAGTAYGNEISFVTLPVTPPVVTTTAATSITQNSAASGGNVTSDGGGEVTARGICWSNSANPTTDNSKTSNGPGNGVFTSSLTDLIPGTTYHIRAYAVNSAGTAYGSDISFTTNPALPATLTTHTISLITLTTAVSGGIISADGGSEITGRGVCWATTANPTISNTKTTDGAGTGSFTSDLTGLVQGTVYHVRAYATNSAGTAYGNDIPFTTLATQLPTVTTNSITSINLTSAVSGGNITSDGGGAVSVSGVCWSTANNPTTGDFKTTGSTANGNFSSTLTGLDNGTTYYVRAYATNNAGTAYGTQVSFSTKIADIDGNTYNTVQIGTQLWMAENLKTTHYNNDAVVAIPDVTDGPTWALLTTPALCWYNDDANTYKPIYGAIYNWFAVTEGHLCPAGWKAPSDEDFNIMEGYLGIPSVDLGTWGWRGTDQGAMLKSTTGWAAGENGTNTSGFTGLPGGYRYGVSGNYNDLGNLTYWWTTTIEEANPINGWYRRVDGSSSQIYKAAVLFQGGKYVRCIKN